MPHRSANAIRTGITTANDNNILAGSVDEACVLLLGYAFVFGSSFLFDSLCLLRFLASLTWAVGEDAMPTLLGDGGVALQGCSLLRCLVAWLRFALMFGYFFT